MRVLVIGSTGYIGSRAAAALAAAGHRIDVLLRPGGTPVVAGYRTVPGDLADPASLTGAVRGYDQVVVAAAPLGDGPDRASVDALVAGGVPLIYTTGTAVLGAGLSDEDGPVDPPPIAAGRAAVERQVLAAGGRVIRPGLVYGRSSGLLRDLFAAKAIEFGTGVYIGEPGVRIPVVHVDDLAELYVAVLERATPGTVWHGVSENVRLDEVAAALGGGTARSWPLADARAQLGPLADLFTRDQQVGATRTRTGLGWRPTRTDLLATLRPVVGSAAHAHG